jgi:hypothetical protein
LSDDRPRLSDDATPELESGISPMLLKALTTPGFVA